MSQTEQVGGFRIRQMRGDEAGQCEAILRELPDWFGIEQAIVRYRHDMEEMETYVAECSGAVAGFLTLTQSNPDAAEIYVMAIRRQYHRRGMGRALVVRAAQVLAQRATAYLQVKTLGPSR